MFCDEHGTADYCGECVYGPEIETLQQQLAASQSEARELRAELARVRELVSGMREYADSCGHPSEVSKRNAVGYWLAQLEDVLSQPAAEQPAVHSPELLVIGVDLAAPGADRTVKAATKQPPEHESLPLMARQEWMRRDTDYFVVHDDFCLEVKALNGRAPYYDESGELVVCAEAGDSIERDRVDAVAQPDGIYRIVDTDERSLPLMARREWMFKGARYAFRDRDSAWFQSVDKPGGVWEFCYRIADTDEHGLPVIERTADMPADARYMQAYADTPDHWIYWPRLLAARLPDETWQRIEDYRECGEPEPECACDERESLPLMARRPRHKDDDLGELYENGKRLCTISGEPPLREPMPGFVLYRIADTDEHGLKVIPREPGMPEWARYRWPTYGGFAYSVVFAPWMRLSSEVVRIEDYRESGQEGEK